jgi:hypothetical protein
MIFSQKNSCVEPQPGQVAVLRALGSTAAATQPAAQWNTTELGVVEPTDTRIAIIPLASGTCLRGAAARIVVPFESAPQPKPEISHGPAFLFRARPSHRPF